MKKRLLSILFITLSMTLSQWAPAFAAAGSLTVELKNESTGAVFGDFTVNVWHVADNSLKPTDGFKNANIDWDMDFSLKANNSQLAADIYRYINRQNIEPTYSKVTGSDGIAYFDGLDGIYFVTAADNRSSARFTFTNFIAPVPFNGNSAVVAAPKGKGPSPGPGPGPGPSPNRRPPTPGTPIGDNDVPRTNPDTPPTVLDEPPVPLADLPQTGVLRWPVPVLGIAGLFAIAAGLRIIRRENAARTG